ncbi:MAG TPA: hypothetical protein VFP45_03440 [Candidatus Nitrosotalea sp.]|nr:hypothetical protein [Candidatus Nitrosotalea sp.]
MTSSLWFLESPTSLPLIQTVLLSLALDREKIHLRPNNMVSGKIDFIGFYGKCSFIKLVHNDLSPNTKFIYWCLEPIIQKDYPVGSEVHIIYDYFSMVDLAEKPEIFFVYKIILTKNNAC